MKIICVMMIVLLPRAVLTVKNDGCTKNMYLHNDGSCHPFIDCQHIDSVVIQHDLSTTGFVKTLFRATVDNMDVVYSYPMNKSVENDFLHGIKMLREFQGSSLVTEMIGYCDEKEKLQLLTKYYKYGSADRLNDVLEKKSLREQLQIRLNFCYDYLAALVFLHDSPLGVRVMCDSNDVMKTLSQFLITDDYRLVMVDLDALPEVNLENNVTVKCGHRQLFGDFVAPEQLWPHDHLVFDDRKMPGYDEKTDVWKIPNVLSYILGTTSMAKQVRFRMFGIFRQCKELESWKRPTAGSVLRTLVDVVKTLNLKIEL